MCVDAIQYNREVIKKNIEDQQDQITPTILYERSHNHHWSIKAFLVYQLEDGKKGYK